MLPGELWILVVLPAQGGNQPRDPAWARPRRWSTSPGAQRKGTALWASPALLPGESGAPMGAPACPRPASWWHVLGTGQCPPVITTFPCPWAPLAPIPQEEPPLGSSSSSQGVAVYSRPVPGPAPSVPWKRLGIRGCSGAHELCTGARSIRQRPVREESKAPAAAGSSFCAETWPLRALRGAQQPVALCCCPSPAPGLCCSARRRFVKCL